MLSIYESDYFILYINKKDNMLQMRKKKIPDYNILKTYDKTERINRKICENSRLLTDTNSFSQIYVLQNT